MENMADKSFREVTVFDFFTAFRSNFKTIFLSSFAVTLVAIIYSLLVTPIFSSTALITLNKDNSQGSQTTGSSSVLETITGGAVSTGSSDAEIAYQQLISREFFKKIYTDKNYIKDFYHADKNVEEDKISSLSSPHFDKAFQDFHNQFLYISYNRKSELITLSLKNMHADKAQYWLQQTIFRVNEYARADDRAQTMKALNFLENQIQSTNILEIRKVLAQLIQQRIQNLMFVESSDEYLFKVIDEPSYPIYRFFPNRTQITITTFIFSMIFFSLISLFNLIRNKTYDESSSAPDNYL
jgi:uncharacterized protein involved in exopolysaccharide biosynthesis